MLRQERYICVTCGRSFTKMVGGVVLSPKEQELMIRPVCDKCKRNNIADIFGMKR